MGCEEMAYKVDLECFADDGVKDGPERPPLVPSSLDLWRGEVLLRSRKFEVDFPLFFGFAARRKAS